MVFDVYIQPYVFDVHLSAASDNVVDVVMGNDGARGAPAAVDLGFGTAGACRDGERLPGYAVRNAATFTNALSGGYAPTPATADAVFHLWNKGVAIGTVTFHAGVSDAVVALTGGEFAASTGDFIYATAPSPADATLADAAFTLAG